MSISAVLPLKATGSYGADDLNRAHILFKSLTIFAEPNLFSEFYVVVPDDEVNLVKETFSRWDTLPIIVISESQLLPELKNYPKMRGWRKQQLLKIAIASHVKDRFYITFDADVIALKPLTLEELIINNRALMQYELRSRHPKWWRASARILKMNPKVGNPKIGMGVTPTILATEICKGLMKELTKNKTWAETICELHVRSNPRNWWLTNYLKLKWTEYSLYYLFAHKYKLIDQYHIQAGSDSTPQLFFDDVKVDFNQWNPESSFSEESPYLFGIVGSKNLIDPKDTWNKVGPFIDPKQPVLF